MEHLYGPLSSQVAESLGITEEFLRKKEVHADGIPCTCTSPKEAPEELEDTGPQKRATEVGVARGAPGHRAASGELLGSDLWDSQHFSSKKRGRLACFFLVLAGWVFSP